MSDVIERLRELDGRATPAPWIDLVDAVIEHFDDIGIDVVEANAAVALAARNALPALLDVVGRAEFRCELCDGTGYFFRPHPGGSAGGPCRSCGGRGFTSAADALESA